MEKDATTQKIINTYKKKKNSLSKIVSLIAHFSHKFVDKKDISLNKSSNTLISEQDLAENFLKNANHMNAICKNNDIKYFCLIQPANDIGKRKLTKIDLETILPIWEEKFLEEHPKGYDLFREIYKIYCANSKRNDHIIDFTRVFDNEKDQVFTDICHFSDYGQAMVAEKIFELIKIKEGSK